MAIFDKSGNTYTAPSGTTVRYNPDGSLTYGQVAPTGLPSNQAQMTNPLGQNYTVTHSQGNYDVRQPPPPVQQPPVQQQYQQPPVQQQYQPPPAQQQYQQQAPTFDINARKDLLNQMFGNRLSSEQTSLQNTRDTQLQGFNKMETGANQQAYNARNQSDAIAEQNAGRLREIMAASGLGRGGENLTAQTGLMQARQGALGDINLQRNNILSDIGERRALTNNQAASQEQALRQAIESDRINAMLDLERYGDDMAFRTDDRDYSRFRDGIGDQRYGDERDYSRFRDAIGDTRYNQQYQDQRGDVNFDRNRQSMFDAFDLESRNISNQIAQFQLDNLPQQLKDQAKLVQQQLEKGQLSIQEAQFNLRQLQDPNSPINQLQQLNLQMAQLEAKYAEPEIKARLAQIKASTAQIGKTPYRSPEQIELDQMKVQVAKMELEQMQNPQLQNNPVAAEETALSQLPPDQAYNLLVSNKSDYIQIFGIERYNKLIDAYDKAKSYR